MGKITQIVQDTREQQGKHRNIERYMREHGVKIIRQSGGLGFGDYTLPLDRRVVIDIKQDILEIVGNLCSADHERIRREFEKAQEVGSRLYILIEENECNGHELTCPDDLVYWESPKYKNNYYRTAYIDLTTQKEVKGKDLVAGREYERKRVLAHQRGSPMTSVKGEVLAKVMKTMEQKYGVCFLFCSKEESGRIILELLGDRRDD